MNEMEEKKKGAGSTWENNKDLEYEDITYKRKKGKKRKK